MKINEYIERLLAHCGVEDAEVALTDEDGEQILVQINLPESESGALIGYHGETLASIQRMVNIIFRDQIEDKRVRVNINDYRQRRTEALSAQVTRIAEQVIETGNPYTFGFLPANERFIVHSTLGEDEKFANLISESSGEGRDRFLTIKLKD